MQCTSWIWRSILEKQRNKEINKLLNQYEDRRRIDQDTLLLLKRKVEQKLDRKNIKEKANIVNNKDESKLKKKRDR